MAFQTSNQSDNKTDNVVNLGDYITGFMSVKRNSYYSYRQEDAACGSVIYLQECRG